MAAGADVRDGRMLRVGPPHILPRHHHMRQRIGIEPRGRPIDHLPPVLEDRDPARDRHHVRHVVAHQDDRLPVGLSRRIRSSTCAVSFTPSAAVGSSITISSALSRSAREIATAWRWPPDRFSTAHVGVGQRDAEPRQIGRRVARACAPCRAGRSASARRRGRRSARSRGAGRARGPGRSSRCRRRARRAASGSAPPSPRTVIAPALGSCAPEMMRISVDLPAPLSPQMPSTSPAATSRSAAAQRLDAP